MRHDKLKSQLDLISILIGNRHCTVEDLCDVLSTSRRNLYHYFDFLREAGFILRKDGRYYNIDRQSPFIKGMFEMIDFNEDEALTLWQILEKNTGGNPLVKSIMKKLTRFYDLDILADDSMVEQKARNISVLYDAIKQKRIVRLVNYSSAHSHSRKDRVVEPYKMLFNNNEVRCFDISTGMSKTFKVSRMESVEMLDLFYANEEHHSDVFIDIFHFSGEKQYDVTLLLGQLSYSLLLDEYPQSRPYITQVDDNHWQLSTKLCSFIGITRFILGLYDDITIVDSPELQEFVNAKIRAMHDRIEKEGKEEKERISLAETETETGK